MEVPRQGGRGRASRSRKHASNKENICPSTARDSISSEVLRRRSPLPEGFPRLPLQDITHVICPQNIWPDNQDSQTDQQVCKKIRKDSPAASCTANELETRPSWKGLIACENVLSGATIVRTAEATKEEGIPNLSTDNKVIVGDGEAKSNTHSQEDCLQSAGVSNESIGPLISIEGELSLQTEEQTKETGQLCMQVSTSQCEHRSAENGKDSLKRDICRRREQTTVLNKEIPTKKPQQTTQLKKKSNLLMFR